MNCEDVTVASQRVHLVHQLWWLCESVRQKPITYSSVRLSTKKSKLEYVYIWEIKYGIHTFQAYTVFTSNII